MVLPQFNKFENTMKTVKVVFIQKLLFGKNVGWQYCYIYILYQFIKKGEIITYQLSKNIMVRI